MLYRISALVALAALATANDDNGGGACVVKTITRSPVTTSTTTPQDNCSTRTVCVDKVNECGMWYGGCIPDCKPWPTFSKPACPPTTTPTTTTTTTFTFPTSDAGDCSTRTVCIDKVNECGMWYGGCVPACKPLPTFSKPACPSSKTLSTVVTASASATATTSV